METLIILDADALVSLVREGLLNTPEFNQIILSDVVEFEIARKADADVEAFLKSSKDRIEIESTSFHGLLEAAKKDSSITLPHDMSELSTYSLTNRFIHEQRSGVVIVSDEWLTNTDARHSSTVRLMSLHELRKSWKST